MSIRNHIADLHRTLPQGVTLVAVSKTYPPEDIAKAYETGQRIFGESRPQEMCAKYESLPKDIEWHMIGHLQTNKVRMIMPFVSLIHSVDSPRLLETINKEAARISRTVDVLLEIYVAEEESKFGWSEAELVDYFTADKVKKLTNTCFRGLMTIASNTDEEKVLCREFNYMKDLHTRLKKSVFDERFDTLSMGMTSDYGLAVECGSTMVRIGSMIFGERDYSK